MNPTFKATLRGDRIVWNGDAPDLSNEQGVAVQITLLEEPTNGATKKPDGHAMASALEKLAAANALRDITDPVEWQREQRR